MPVFAKDDLIGFWRDLSQARRDVVGGIVQKLHNEQLDTSSKKRPYLIKAQKLASADTVQKQKRRKSAWDHYLAKQRDSMMRDHPEYTIGRVSQEAAKLWRAMSDKQKARFDLSDTVVKVPKVPKKPSVANMKVVEDMHVALDKMYPNGGMPKTVSKVLEKYREHKKLTPKEAEVLRKHINSEKDKKTKGIKTNQALREVMSKLFSMEGPHPKDVQPIIEKFENGSSISPKEKKLLEQYVNKYFYIPLYQEEE